MTFALSVGLGQPRREMRESPSTWVRFLATRNILFHANAGRSHFGSKLLMVLSWYAKWVKRFSMCQQGAGSDNKAIDAPVLNCCSSLVWSVRGEVQVTTYITYKDGCPSRPPNNPIL